MPIGITTAAIAGGIKLVGGLIAKKKQKKAQEEYERQVKISNNSAFLSAAKEELNKKLEFLNSKESQLQIEIEAHEELNRIIKISVISIVVLISGIILYKTYKK